MISYLSDLVERAGRDFECHAADFVRDDGRSVERNRLVSHDDVRFPIVNVLDD